MTMSKLNRSGGLSNMRDGDSSDRPDDVGFCRIGIRLKQPRTSGAVRVLFQERH